MFTLSKPATLFLFLLIFCSGVQGQNSYHKDNKGFINFNFGAAKYPPGKYQKVSLFACNTYITDSILTKTPDNGTPNQVISGIPNGWQFDKNGKKSYYVSKYYIASPPIMKILTGDTLYDIGIVTPDEFNMVGEKPVQLVYLDYNVLKPVYIEYINIEFDSSFSKKDSFPVPFRIEAPGFPWLDSNGLSGAKGASGIGYLKNDTKDSIPRLFLPYYYSANGSKVYLNFQITILNDILLRNDVFFKIGNALHTTINLADYKDKKQKIKFSRKPKKELPCGCKEPEQAKPVHKPHTEKSDSHYPQKK